MGIGKRIAQLRKQKNLTQSDLAKMIYVSPKTNMGDVIITIPIDRDTVIENYLKNS